jgi:hypothetical protein
VKIWPKHLVHIITLNTAKVLCLVEIYNYLLVNYNKTGWIPSEQLDIKVNLTHLNTQSVPRSKHTASSLQIQSVNLSYKNNRCLLSDPHKTRYIFNSVGRMWQFGLLDPAVPTAVSRIRRVHGQLDSAHVLFTALNVSTNIFPVYMEGF